MQNILEHVRKVFKKFESSNKRAGNTSGRRKYISKINGVVEYFFCVNSVS